MSLPHLVSPRFMGLVLAAGAAIAALAASTASVAAQIERPIPYPIPQSAAWKRAVANGTRTNTGAPGKNYWTNFTDYKIKAELVPKTAVVKGHIEMTYHNRSPNPIASLQVHLRQNLYKAGNVRNRYVEITGGVKVSNLQVDGEDLRPARSRFRMRPGTFMTTGTVMRIRLPEEMAEVPSGEKVKLSMDWEFRVPAAGAEARRNGWSVIRQGHDNHQVFYLGYWYPQMAVYEDVAGWVAEQYMSNSEFYMGYGNYDLEFTVPEGWLVRATGSLENPEKVLTKQAIERLKEARTGRDIVHVIDADDLEDGNITAKGEDGKLTWHFKSKDVRDIAVSISDRYLWDATHAVVKDKHGEGKDGIAMIHAVYRSGARARRNRNGAEYARHTIEFMSKTVYPYPWPHMTACEGIIGGGMEFPMMTICGGLSGGLVAHELIHMWFPMIVGSNEKARAWQDEGFTSFYTTLTTADYSKLPSARRSRMNMAMYARIAAGGESAPCMTHGDLYPSSGRGGYGLASYTKTECILHQLRGMVGDEVFFKAFRKYTRDWAFQHPYPKDFFNAFSTAAGQDLGWYFRIWFFETWTLDQAVKSVKQEGDGTEVVIEDLGLATHPTEVQVTYDDGEQETKKVDVKVFLSGKKTATLRFKKGVEKVVIDPRGVTLDINRRNNTWSGQ